MKLHIYIITDNLHALPVQTSGIHPPIPPVPDTPGSPKTPETPATKETPKTPETPKSPKTPVTPESPRTPSSPVTPETPVTPGTVPTVPDTPETPVYPCMDNFGGCWFEKPTLFEFQHELPRIPTPDDLPEVANVDDDYDIPVAPEAPKREEIMWRGR